MHQSRNSDQNFSVSFFESFRPTVLYCLNRAAQSGLRGGFGVAGDSVAKIAPFRVIVTFSPSSIHLAISAKRLRSSRTVAVFMRDTNLYHGADDLVNVCSAPVVS